MAETALSLGIPTSVHPVWDRKCVKRTVMTIPYNAKPFSNRSYIKEALQEKGIEVDKDQLTTIVKAVREAMHMIVPGPMSVMKWIETEVSKSIKRGADYVEWTTPSGFVVKQRIMKKKVERLDLQLLGRCQLSVATDETNDVDLSRHKAATAPNLIHSLDASLLHLAVRSFDEPIALIHDSVLSRCCDMDKLSAIIRETYMILFAEHDYLRDFAFHNRSRDRAAYHWRLTTRNGYRIHLFFLLTMIYNPFFSNSDSLFSSFFAPTEIYVVAKEDIEKAQQAQYKEQVEAIDKRIEYLQSKKAEVQKLITPAKETANA